LPLCEIYIYIYIYIEREREREREMDGDQKGDFLNAGLVGSSSSFDLQRLWPRQGRPSCGKASQRPKPTSTLEPDCSSASPSMLGED